MGALSTNEHRTIAEPCTLKVHQSKKAHRSKGDIHVHVTESGNPVTVAAGVASCIRPDDRHGLDLDAAAAAWRSARACLGAQQNTVARLDRKTRNPL
jgi:hypothetical protein